LRDTDDYGDLEGDAAAMLMTVAPILISFSFRLDSDQHCVASVLRESR